MGAVTRDFLGIFTAGLRTIYDDAFQAQKGLANEMATFIPSFFPSENYGWLSELPQMREFTDERVIKGLFDYEYTIRNRKFEATIALDREVLEDELYGQVRARINGLAEAAAAHYDQILFQLLATAQTTACYDGQPFYSAAHIYGGNTFGNLDSLPLTEDNVEAVLTRMQQRLLDNNEPMLVTPSHLLVGPALRFKAKRILNSNYYPEAVAGSTVLAINPVQGELQLLVSPRITSATEWHILDLTHSVRPFIIQQKVLPELQALDGTMGETEESFLRDRFLYGVRSRDNAGFGLWQYAYKGNS